ncbi:GldG family protein, partial [Patescibacteria group bacterium]|nr:GldG family protein [Patescibacteria group bacterium]
MFHSSKIFLFTAIFIIINILSGMFFTRFDFTQGQIYTLSDASKKIVTQLPDGIEIKTFVSETMPAQFVTAKNELVDKLSEYQNIAGGKIKVTYLDPVTDSSAEELTQSLGVPPLDLQIVEKDQLQVVKAYFGLAVFKEKSADSQKPPATSPLSQYEKYEVLPVVNDLGTLEYDLGSMLLKVGSTTEPTIGFLEGHGEHGLAQSNSYAFAAETNPRDDYQLQEELSRNYNVTQVSLTTPEGGEEGVDPLADIDTLIIAGPTEELYDDEISQIHQFVTSGKNAIFLIDSMNVDLQFSFSAFSQTANYDKLLSPWGISVQPALIADQISDMASFNQGFVTYSLPYPFFVKVSNLNPDNSITRDIESFTLPWASPLNITPTEGVSIETLASTSPYYNLFEEQVIEVPTENTSEAETTDNPENPDTPNETKQQKTPIDLNPQQEFGITDQTKDALPLVVMAQKANEGKAIFIGDSDFLSQTFPGNILFFQNAVDALSLDDTLIQIRSKGISDRPIKPLSDSQKNTIRWGLTLGVP